MPSRTAGCGWGCLAWLGSFWATRCSFRLLTIGNRLGTLIMAGVPVCSGIGAWLFLNEQLVSRDILGIIVCVSGISLVVLERGSNGGAHSNNPRQYTLGILCALGGALGQAGGLILAKTGSEGDFPSISGVTIRMLTAAVIMWVAALFAGQAKDTFAKLRHNPQVARSLLAGSLVGPFIGVWLSQIAVQHSYIGIASTLMAMTPILMLPIARWHYQEIISPRALIGTLLALAGVAVIFL